MIVIKLGGRTFETPEGRDRLLGEVARFARGQQVVLVHGGGIRITAALAEAGVEAKFVRGLRVTDAPTLRVAERVLREVGAEIRDGLAAHGAKAAAVAGCDRRLFEGELREELGLVGRITRVNPEPLLDLVKGGTLPVVAPLGWSAASPVLNVNADEAAGRLAADLPASWLILLTDVDKVLGADGPLDAISIAQAEELIAAGTAKDGMAPKLEAAVTAARNGCSVVIANGNRSGVLADALAGAAGTKVV